jgi:hypothetical protein
MCDRPGCGVGGGLWYADLATGLLAVVVADEVPAAPSGVSGGDVDASVCDTGADTRRRPPPRLPGAFGFAAGLAFFT